MAVKDIPAHVVKPIQTPRRKGASPRLLRARIGQVDNSMIFALPVGQTVA